MTIKKLCRIHLSYQNENDRVKESHKKKKCFTLPFLTLSYFLERKHSSFLAERSLTKSIEYNKAHKNPTESIYPTKTFHQRIKFTFNSEASSMGEIAFSGLQTSIAETNTEH